jgi:beta-galactosidase
MALHPTPGKIIWILFFMAGVSGIVNAQHHGRKHVLINDDWRFFKYSTGDSADNLIYDVRPEVVDNNDSKAADSKPTEAVIRETNQEVLKSWILASANNFIKDESDRHIRPPGNPGENFPFVKSQYDDTGWKKVNLPSCRETIPRWVEEWDDYQLTA